MSSPILVQGDHRDSAHTTAAAAVLEVCARITHSLSCENPGNRGCDQRKNKHLHLSYSCLRPSTCRAICVDLHQHPPKICLHRSPVPPPLSTVHEIPASAQVFAHIYIFAAVTAAIPFQDGAARADSAGAACQWDSTPRYNTAFACEAFEIEGVDVVSAARAVPMPPVLRTPCLPLAAAV